MRKQNGLIDPYTLGFLIALIGSAIVMVHDDPIAATNTEAPTVVTADNGIN